MPNGWQQRYIELTDFVAKNPTIEIGRRLISVPQDIRPEFYKLFDAVRAVLVKEKFPEFRNEARPLGENYLKAEQEVITLLGLSDISLPTILRIFLQDPIDGLIREMFTSLFDLLQGKVDKETFEQKALMDVEAAYRSMYRSGYQKWVALSLVKLLEADKIFQVFLQRLSPELEVNLKTDDSQKGPVPPPQESRSLSFEHEPTNKFTVPDFIIHSAGIKRYIALRSGLDEALTNASNASEKREWLPLDSMTAIEPGLTLIYLADNLEEISLVADRNKICRPDMIIEFREQKDWYEKEKLEKVKLYHSILKPRMGAYVVSRELVPEQAYREIEPEQVSEEPTSGEEQKTTPQQEPEKQEPGIHILTVGFDQSELEPIIGILLNEVL